MQHQRVVVSGFILHEGKLLLVQRAADDAFLPGNWELPGGKVDWGEDPHDTLVRELREETGLTVRPGQVYQLAHYVRADRERHVIEAGMVGEVVGDTTVTLSAEHQAYRWVGEEEAAALEPVSDFMRQQIRAGFVFVGR